ncbi:MAG: site-specific integrase [Gallicola sp.]|nr:site-specific integrase [Gallicola sp.]
MPVYKDNKTKSWYVRFKYKNWLGNTKHVTKRGFLTKREALIWEENFRSVKDGSNTMTFDEFASVYFEDLKPRLKLSTMDTKRSIIESQILPYFSRYKLCDIEATHVMKWQNELLKHRNEYLTDGFKSSYLKTIHNQLSAIFNHAIKYYGLKENPARIVGNMGKEGVKEMKFWTKEQYLKFVETIMDQPMAYVLFQILYWCGLRRGEVLALVREDFDLKLGMLRINKTFHRKNGKDVITSPKTPKSNRMISVPDFLCQELEVFFQMNYQLGAMDRVFPVTASFISKNLEKGANEAKLPRIRVHDLRHSHVSLLANMGFSAVAIAQRMGHESIDITYRYAHLFPSVQAEIANKLSIEQGSESNDKKGT